MLRLLAFSPTKQLEFILSFIVTLAIFALSWGSPLVEANGRATLVTSQQQGPYRIDVSIIPGQAILSNTHLSILIRSLNDESIITSADVIVSATGPAGSADLGPIPALNNYDPQFFEMDLPFDTVGQWTVTVDVATELGQESISLSMDVREGGTTINWIMIAALIVAIIAVGVFTWDKVTGRKAKLANSE